MNTKTSALCGMLIASLLLAGCTVPNANGEPASGDTVTVHMKDMKYSPQKLTVAAGTTVEWVNDDPFGHTVTPLDTGKWQTAGSGDDPEDWMEKGDRWSFRFDTPGTYEYYCKPHASVKDGKASGMVGTITVVTDATHASSSVTGPSGPDAALPVDVAEIGRPATDVPPPIERLQPAHVTFDIMSREVTAAMADGTTYTYWTFDGQVPGPMLRARVGDTITVRHHNDASSTTGHNIDLHAVTGPGGGAHALDALPGQTAELTFEALSPGVFVYHCAYQNPPLHIAHGMYGLIVIEPEEGLPPVDKEFYVMQGDFYSPFDASQKGHHEFSMDNALAEDPSFVVFNGRMGSLAGDRALQAAVGDDVRLFVGNGGPNLASSFHVIGEIFDRVYHEGDLVTDPAEGIQTTLVPAGGATAVEVGLEVSGDYLLVDHSIFRVLKGAAGFLHVTGTSQEGVFEPAE